MIPIASLESMFERRLFSVTASLARSVGDILPAFQLGYESFVQLAIATNLDTKSIVVPCSVGALL
jgi:hypothetical protein